MSRYRGPRLRVTRRLGELPGLTRKASKKSNPPGQHGQARRKRSEYAIRLEEKQKLRFNYGVSERQLVRYVKKARAQDGSTGTNLLRLLENRLDNVCFRLGFGPTIPGSRQLVNHGLICIGDQKVTIPSYPVSRDEEEHIKYHPSSGLNNPEHAIRKAIEGRREKAEYAVEEVDPEATPEFAAEVKAAAEAAPTVETGGDE